MLMIIAVVMFSDDDFFIFAVIAVLVPAWCLIHRSCSTLRTFTTWMGDYLLTGKLSWYVPNLLGQLRLPSLRVG